jgi:26S proteasome regulatory subunit N5
MITYYDHEKDYFEAAKCYQTIYETILKHQLMDDPQQALERMITYLLLVEYSAEQVDLMVRIKEKENKNADVKAVLGILLSSEIGRVPVGLKEQLQDEEKWKMLVRRINQHNVRVVQKYYSRISLRRLSELLELSLEATEEELRDMVSYMGFKAKINRPEGFVYFPKGTETAGLLNNWGANIFSLLNRLEEISHLIQREASVSG